MKMTHLLAIVACLLLASCATMKNADARPTEGICMMTYDTAKSGEKEFLTGEILLPVGLGLMLGGFPVYAKWVSESFKEHDTMPWIVSGSVMMGVGGASVIVGIVLLIDGKSSIDKWNDSCVGATAAERYCLFEPLPTSQGETP